MKFLRLSIAALVLAGFAGGVDAAAQPSADPSLYSFSDLCRLTAEGEAPASPPALQAQGIPVSLSMTPGPQKAAYVFSTGSIPQPGRWPLMLSGLAAAAWVARRRLGYSL